MNRKILSFIWKFGITFLLIAMSNIWLMAEDESNISGWFRTDTDAHGTQIWFGASHPFGSLEIDSDIYVVGATGEFDIGPLFTLVEKENSKTAHFLEASEVDKVENGKVYIKVNNVNDFVFNTLCNDEKIIEKSISIILNTKCKVELVRGKIKDEEENNVSRKKNIKEDEHPLFMDALNKFEGQIIK